MHLKRIAFKTICACLLLSSSPAFAQSYAGGSGISLFLCADSTISIWGNNVSYCGSDTTHIIESTVPVPVGFISGILEIASGATHSLALKSDGTVWAWGGNANGSLGVDTSIAASATPLQVSGLASVNKISGNFWHSFAFKNDGTVWAWGNNEFGQLGNGSVNALGCYCVSPAGQINALTGAVAVAAGWNHSLALKSDGTVLSFGDNSKGQLGDNSFSVNPIPTLVPGLTDVASVSCGRNHSVALKNDGTVWAWGDNVSGQIGIVSDTSATACICEISPQQVPGLTNVMAISAGDDFTIALKSDSTVWSWGQNMYGQLGNGSAVVFSFFPVQVSGLSGIRSIKAAYEHSLAYKSDGTLWAWGWNKLGQLGNGTTNTTGCECERTPVMVNSLCPPLLAGINEQELENDVIIFPNPASNQVSIQSGKKIKTFTCVNALGQSLDVQPENNVLDVSSLSTGLYFIIIQLDDNTRAVKRFVKQ